MATTDADPRIFIDTNALIRLHVSVAPLHDEVRRAIEDLITTRNELWISRQVLREYAAVLTREQPYTAPIPPADVVRQLRLFEARYRVAEESATVTAAFYQLLETVPMGGKQIHDANIVATMQAHNISRLFTLNVADFARFSAFITITSL